VQHHHAHLASVLAEHGLADRAIGIILDGTGLGTDGTIWGGEVLVGDAAGFERFAWLEPVPLPGGTAAIREPWRMAVSYLHYAFGDGAAARPWPFAQHLGETGRDLLLHMISRRLNSPLTSSCGRLFDGAAALLGIAGHNTYEAQAAIALEAAATSVAAHPIREAARDTLPGAAGPIDFRALVRTLVERRDAGGDVHALALEFHLRLAELFVAAARAARERTGISLTALSGGVYQNALFFEYLQRRLVEERFEVISHRQVPTNDGGIALGQVVIADALARAA
jgi:hydrogenase maturation protein HypF